MELQTENHQIVSAGSAVRKKRPAEPIRVSEIRYRRLFESARDGILILDALTRKITDANPFMIELLGYRREEFIGKELWQIGLLKDEQASRDAFQELESHGFIRYENLPLKTKSGTLREVEFVSNVYDEAGHSVIQCNIRDITERKKSELLQAAVYGISEASDKASTLEELYASVHKIIGTVMSAANFYISIYDSKTDLISFPYFIDEVDTHQVTVSPRRGLTEYVLRTGQSILCDETVDAKLRATGEVELIGSPSAVWLGVPLLIEGSAIGVMVVQHYSNPKAYGQPELRMLEYVSAQVARAIHRKLEESLLRKSEEGFRLISENVADLIAVLDLEGNRVYTSPSYHDILGDKGMLEGVDSFEAIHPEDRERIKAEFFKTVNTGIGTKSECRFLLKDGTVRHIESYRSVVKDNDGKVSNIIVVSRDITERMQLSEQLMRAQRLESIGTLAGGIAHDLNNVLAPILMAIEILKRSASNDVTFKILETLEKSAKRGSEIVKQVLGFARGLEGERIALNIRHVIKELISMMEQTLPKSISVNADISADCWLILGDSTQLYQVLINLCVNARDAMPQGGTLTISARNEVIDAQYAHLHIDARPGRYVALSVQDSGTGIPPHVIDRIFDPFFTTKEVGKGTGLGLATVHAIIKSHGGFINVYSEPGKGTTFNLYLPATGEVQAITLRAETSGMNVGGGELILVIDDEAAICSITKQTLEAYGYRAITASNGAEAIKQYAAHRGDISLVLTDMMMPVMDGAQTILALRGIDPALKIIASSGLLSDKNAATDVNATFDQFIQKPYAADRLLKAIHEVLHAKPN